MRYVVWTCVLACLVAVAVRVVRRPSVAACELRARIAYILRVPEEDISNSWLAEANVEICSELRRASELLDQGAISRREFDDLSRWSSQTVLAFCRNRPAQDDTEDPANRETIAASY